MALFVRNVSRPAFSCIRRQPSGLLTQRSNFATRPSAFEEMETFWVKNKNSNRPLSPHLTIFKPHATMNVSITNRIAAVAIQTGITLGGIYLLMSPHKFPVLLDQLKQSSLGYSIVVLTKLTLALTFAFHLIAGGRHLFWDFGLIGKSKALTLNGSYAVVGLSALCCLALMLMKPSVQKN